MLLDIEKQDQVDSLFGKGLEVAPLDGSGGCLSLQKGRSSRAEFRSPVETGSFSMESTITVPKTRIEVIKFVPRPTKRFEDKQKLNLAN